MVHGPFPDCMCHNSSMRFKLVQRPQKREQHEVRRCGSSDMDDSIFQTDKTMFVLRCSVFTLLGLCTRSSINDLASLVTRMRKGVGDMVGLEATIKLQSTADEQCKHNTATPSSLEAPEHHSRRGATFQITEKQLETTTPE